MEHWYPKRRFGDLYDEAAARWPDRDALVYRDRRYTFAGSRREGGRGGARAGRARRRPRRACRALAHQLRRVGVRPFRAGEDRRRQRAGEHTLPHPRPRLCAEAVGQRDAGRARCFGAGGLPRHDARARPGRSSPACARSCWSPRGGCRTASRTGVQALEAGRAVPDEEVARRAAEVDPDAVAFIMYTSGTTGFPKGAMHTHKIIRNNEERGFKMGLTVERHHPELPAALPRLRLFRRAR